MRSSFVPPVSVRVALTILLRCCSGELRRRITVTVGLGDCEVQAVVSTGFEQTTISESVARRCNLRTRSPLAWESTHTVLADGRSVKHKFTAAVMAFPEFDGYGFGEEPRPIVVLSDGEDMSLGFDVMSEFECSTHPSKASQWHSSEASGAFVCNRLLKMRPKLSRPKAWHEYNSFWAWQISLWAWLLSVIVGWISALCLFAWGAWVKPSLLQVISIGVSTIDALGLIDWSALAAPLIIHTLAFLGLLQCGLAFLRRGDTSHAVHAAAPPATPLRSSKSRLLAVPPATPAAPPATPAAPSVGSPTAASVTPQKTDAPLRARGEDTSKRKHAFDSEQGTANRRVRGRQTPSSLQ